MENSTALCKAVEFFLDYPLRSLIFQRFFRVRLWKNLWKMWITHVMLTSFYCYKLNYVNCVDIEKRLRRP